MNVQFLLFVIAILLVLVFWELSKINSVLKKKTRSPARGQERQQAKGTLNIVHWPPGDLLAKQGIPLRERTPKFPAIPVTTQSLVPPAD